MKLTLLVMTLLALVACTPLAAATPPEDARRELQAAYDCLIKAIDQKDIDTIEQIAGPALGQEWSTLNREAKIKFLAEGLGLLRSARVVSVEVVNGEVAANTEIESQPKTPGGESEWYRNRDKWTKTPLGWQWVFSELKGRVAPPANSQPQAADKGPTTSDAGNAITTATKHATVQLWASDRTVADGKTLQSAVIDCRGYKEVRVMMQVDPSDKLKAWFCYVRPDGRSAFQPGYFSFARANNPFTGNANFTLNTTGHCMFSMPVYSDKCFIQVENNSGRPVTMEAIKCWAYLVN